MKQLFTTFLMALSIVTSFAQGARPQPVCDCFPCCPQVLTVTIAGSQLDSLAADSLLILTPAAGKGIRLVKPPVIRSYHDNTMSFASGEYVGIVNEFGDDARGGYGGGLMTTFGDALISPWDGIGAGSFWHSYYMPYNGQSTPPIPHVCTGSIYVVSTFPISGGGPNAKLVITIWYEEVAF